VVFHPLAIEQIRGIARIQLQDLQARLAEQELTLEISDVFMDRLVSVGFDPVYGARPLRRAIQQELENPLAQRILAGDLQPGDIIAVDFEEGQSSFTVLEE
jgi:ATP-dependent Clp protease ATP-binding subunit ClpB